MTMLYPSRPRARILSLAVLASLAAPALAGQPLFVDAPASAKSAAASSVAAQHLSRQPSTATMRLVSADASLVSADTREIELDLGPRRVNAVLQNFKDTGRGSAIWTGAIRKTAKAAPRTAREVKHDEANAAILVRRGEGVTGNIRVDGTLYRIRPLADGGHAVIEVNESLMPPEHAPGYRDNDLPQIPMSAARAAGTDAAPLAVDPGATATIRVQVVATHQAVTAYGGDMQALVELAVAESNQGYANSNVGIQLELANYRTVEYTSAGDGHFTDEERFADPSDGYMDDIHASRDANAADVNVLIINDGGNCGLAHSIGSTADTAFATVHYDCATGYYSFAHEIGHLLSARHDPAADPTNTPYVYGHGYRYEPATGNKWRTIMAYNCTGGCPRLNYWSNPDVSYDGVPMGTADRNHNQRVLVQTKAVMAGFRGTSTPPGGGTQTYSNDTDVGIADRATVESPITVAGRTGNAPNNVKVAVNIQHTYRADLKVDLVAPDGSLYNLHNRSGGSADNIVGTFTKDLSSETLNGTWKLRVNDGQSGDIGKIDSWSITF